MRLLACRKTWRCIRMKQAKSDARDYPCQFKDGQKMVVEFDLMEPNTFDAKNGVIIRAVSVLPLE